MSGIEEIDFIHVGRTGGTTFKKLFGEVLNIKNVYHVKDYNSKDKKTILNAPPEILDNRWVTIVRDPLERVLSAFNVLKLGNSADRATIINLDPVISYNNMKYYDVKELKYFENAEQFLEALSDDPNSDTYKAAHFLMNHEHIGGGFKSFFHNNPRSLWLSMNHELCLHVAVMEDRNWIKKIAKKFETEIKPEINLKQNNIYRSNSLSKKARFNFLKYHLSKDYRILGMFVSYNLIDKSVYLDYIKNLVTCDDGTTLEINNPSEDRWLKEDDVTLKN
jgi:hypothetical protein